MCKEFSYILNDCVGYINVSEGADLFYVLVKPPNQPSGDLKQGRLAVVLNGGPGVSSFDSFFFGYGPVRMSETQKMSVETNPLWLETAARLKFSMLFVDQPAGTGFSFNGKGSGRISTVRQASDEFGTFLDKFVQAFSEYVDASVYFVGESFAGTFIPHFVNDLLKQKSSNKYYDIRGIILGNGWFDPVRQYMSFIEYSRSKNLVPVSFLSEALQMQQSCLDTIQSGNGGILNTISSCDEIVMALHRAWRKHHQSDLYFNEFSVSLTDSYRGYRWPPTISDVTAYLNKGSVKTALNVLPAKTWRESAPGMYEAFSSDTTSPAITLFNGLLTQVPIYLLVGDDDLVSNIIGTEWSVGNLTKTQVREMKRSQWGSGGHCVSPTANLSLCTVYGGSHMLGYDKPQAVWHSMEHMITGKLPSLNSGSGGMVPMLPFLFIAVTVLGSLLYRKYRRDKYITGYQRHSDFSADDIPMVEHF